MTSECGAGQRALAERSRAPKPTPRAQTSRLKDETEKRTLSKSSAIVALQSTTLRGK